MTAGARGADVTTGISPGPISLFRYRLGELRQSLADLVNLITMLEAALEPMRDCPVCGHVHEGRCWESEG